MATPKLQVGETLNKILLDLRSREEKVRVKAAHNLKQYVASESREMSGETFTKFMNDLNRRIFELVNSSDSNEKMGGILAIDELIDIETEENATKITRFANYLRIVLPNNEPQTMVMASKALGHLAAAGGTLTVDFVEFEVKRALEWLQGERYEPRRHAAVLVLKEFAENAPTLFYVHVNTFFDAMWVALRDPKVVIREGAEDALRACLELIAQRESVMRSQWYRKIFDEVQKGVEKNNSDSIHGSLLALGELLRNASDYMQVHTKEVCELILRYREHRDRLVRRTVITLIPRLATFASEIFAEQYLRVCVNHILGALKKDSDRATSYLALGEFAMAIGAASNPYLEQMIGAIKEGLSPKNRKQFHAEALTCVSMLAKAVGPALRVYTLDLLEQMFAAPLSATLIDALADMAAHIPELLSEIQDRLLNRLSLILANAPYRAPGTPARPGSVNITGITAITAEQQDAEAVTLALRTLGTFNLSGHSLTEFVRDCVLNYTDDDNPVIRKEAALTCSKLLASKEQVVSTRGHAAMVVSLVLERLLMVGVADPEPSIRHDVLASLDPRFDHHLAQAENLRSLFIALNDEVFQVRSLAIAMIGRLTIRNPAYVMPSLRKTLIQLLTELEFSGDSRNKEESAQLLAQLIRSARRLIQPYVEPVLKSLLPKLNDPSQGVATCVLAALGDLSQVAGTEMTRRINDLMPQIIDTLQDQSSATKREVALRTLGKVVESTGDVIEPYLKFPNLLNIILQMLKTETAPASRYELIKVIGILGALDPYKHKMNLLEIQSRQEADRPRKSANGSDVLPGMGPSSEEYYPTVAITALMRILRDPSLSTHHTMVIQAVMFIFKSLGLKCVPFLPQIMPPFLQVMRTCEPNFRDFLFQQLGMLVSIVKHHIRNYLDEIFELIHENWNTSLLNQIILLVEEISTALNDEFKVYLADLIPSMLNVLHTDRSERRSPTQKVLHALEVFGTNLDDYLHLVIPALVKLFEQVDAPVNVRLVAIQTLGRLSKKLNFSDYASRIIHPLVRVLDVPYQDLRREAMETLCALVYQLGVDYAIFAPMVNKVLTKQRIQHARYEQLVAKLLKGQPLPVDPSAESDDRSSDARGDESLTAEIGPVKKLHVNQQNLKKAWEASQRSTKEDWNEWIRRFSVELLRESPSPALRSCSALAQVYYPLAKELFNAGFVSCWTELYDPYQDLLVRSLETALMSPNIPPEILQTLLNLAEFMEHDDKPLPIDIRTLGLMSEKCHAYAKALHYKEIEFHSSSGNMSNTIEALISINNQLQQPEAAIGILLYAQQTHSVELKESWYEKLHRWEDALEAYERKQLEDPGSLEVTLGMMRSLNALGEWDRLGTLSQDTWRAADDQTRSSIAPLAAAAAWNLGQWEAMDSYVQAIDPNSGSGCFFRAILALHRDQFELSQQCINKARRFIDTELTALVGESYDRAYNQVVRVQQLSELEEMIEFKRSADDPERRSTMKKLWAERLKGCQRNVEVWQQILAVRSVVSPPSQDVEMYLKFASLCRKSGRLPMSYKTLVNLLDFDPAQDSSRRLPLTAVGFAYLKHQWAVGNKDQAFNGLRTFVQQLEENPIAVGDTRLQARCYLKLGEWQLALEENLDEALIPEILASFRAATEFDNTWYKAWHSLALNNFTVVNFYNTNSNAKVDNDRITGGYVVPAIQGFFRSIALGHGGSSTLQDTLRLLTLWFQYGNHKDVEHALKDGFGSVSIDTWLHVIPQLIARIHSPVPPVRRMIHELLNTIGKEHPQALVYPLTVASKSMSETRRSAALSIMDRMRQHSAILVEQANLVSEELIRVAILWHEMWHEGLEEASRLYFGNHDVEAMFSTLRPLHEMLDRGPETMRETSFQQAFGRDLQEALEWCRKYQRSGKVSDLNQAWDLYYHVFRRINKQLPQLTTLELQYVSPKLLDAQNLELAVPGTYKSNRPVVKIQNFSQTLTVITSKQRPRKLTIHGSNGHDFFYLLKGHEDLRQDERVMQLFGLVNALLAADRETSKRHLSIQRYAVIPLSPNSGIIEWVPYCDTLHSLIREYREARKILLNIEHRLMLQMAPDYDNLTLMQKVEVFEYALDNTTGQDLYKVLWLKSRNSEVWLDRRTNYTRSLAVMSMVGYILGLGDRHPSNIMQERFSGKSLHIDFGDCFEVAQHRDKFPERVPFRLTRMLISAMEVSGIEGNFRFTCESVMRVLRANRESVMAVLEAFVHDPLINWRLLAPSPEKKKQQKPKDLLENDGPPQAQAQDPHAQRAAQQRELETEAVDDTLQNPRALAVVARVRSKLTGKDFVGETLDVPQQVQRLILQATSHENLSTAYVGWCAFW